MSTDLESRLAQAIAEDTAEQRHLDALRAAGIPPVLEADALASYRQVRQTALIFDAAFGAPKLNVFAGSSKAYTQPLWCNACGARYSQDCECPRYEIPLGIE